jgi:UDP-glucose-4-epimerase GalE
VLVVGGAGYIGSETVRTLQAAGRDVVVLDNLADGGDARAVPGVPLVQADVRDQATVRAAVLDHGVDSVIHFAAHKAAGESMDQPSRYFENNVAGTIALLGVLEECRVRKLVFSSTCAVYGTPTTLPVDEHHRLAPESPYGESKLLVERMLAWYDRRCALRSVSLRYFNAAGASAGGDFGEDWRVSLNLIPLVMKAALGRSPDVQVFGTDYETRDGTAIRDYVHVADLADAHIRALTRLDDDGESAIVNLGTGQGSSVLEVLASAQRAAGMEIPVVYAPRRAGDPVAVYADNTYAHDLLGWIPAHDLDAITDSAWRWHSGHPDGYSSARGADG